jgi:hypothetical protein
MAFDFDTDVEVGYDVVRAVASEIAGGGLKPLSWEEIAQREIERETRQELNRQREKNNGGLIIRNKRRPGPNRRGPNG